MFSILTYGLSVASAIARQMDTNESTVRGWLDPAKQERRTVALKTADSLAETMGERLKHIRGGKGGNISIELRDQDRLQPYS